jgi:hypothetical protein
MAIRLAHALASGDTVVLVLRPPERASFGTLGFVGLLEQVLKRRLHRHDISKRAKASRNTRGTGKEGLSRLP